MSAESITYALLSGAGPVTSIVGTRIYPVMAPQGVAMPAIVYELVSLNRLGELNASGQPTQLTRARVQVNLIGPDAAQLLALRNAVVAAMQFQRGTVGGSLVYSVLHAGETAASFDAPSTLFHRPVDFSVTFED